MITTRRSAFEQKKCTHNFNFVQLCNVGELWVRKVRARIKIHLLYKPKVAVLPQIIDL